MRVITTALCHLSVWGPATVLVAAAPNDPDFALQWFLQNTGQMVNGTAGTAGADIHVLDAWAIYGGSANNVTVGIIDTGVDPHVEFGARLLDGYVAPLAGGDPYSTLDTAPHGTYVAGIVGAAVNNVAGMAGIHGNVSLLPVRVLEGATGSERSTAQGIQWAVDQGAQVIVVALQFYDGTQELRDAVAYAGAHDVVVVAPAGHIADGTVAFPGAIEGCIAVASTTADDAAADFSNFGPEVDLSAPSVNIWSTWTNDGYSFEPHGSSGAGAALVAGVAALIRSYNPQLSAVEVEQILKDSADDLGEPGWDEHFGFGRLNAGRALQMTPAPALRFELVTTLPETLIPGQVNTFTVRIVNGSQTLIGPSARAFYRTQPGAFTQSVALRALGNNVFAVDLPPFSCGADADFYLTARGNAGAVVNDPPGAPTNSRYAKAVQYDTLLEDDFEDNLGWTSIVDGPADTTGAWVRMIPVGTSAQPYYDRTPNFGEYCYITGQHFGGNDGTNDVDKGPVRLVSPVIPISSNDIHVSYAAWLHTTVGTPDSLTVELSRNGGASWTLAETIGNTAGWETHGFHVNDFPALTGSNLRVRFTTSDLPSDSLTEASIDDFRAIATSCSAQIGDSDHDGDTDLTDFHVLSSCMNGPSGSSPSGSCVLFDLNGDGHVDLGDLRAFENAFGH